MTGKEHSRLQRLDAVSTLTERDDTAVHQGSAERDAEHANAAPAAGILALARVLGRLAARQDFARLPQQTDNHDETRD